MVLKEQIVHDLAVVFAKHDLDEYVAGELANKNIVDDLDKLTYLTNSYKQACIAIKEELSK